MPSLPTSIPKTFCRLRRQTTLRLSSQVRNPDPEPEYVHPDGSNSWSIFDADPWSMLDAG
jgi:hypothetical protein